MLSIKCLFRTILRPRCPKLYRLDLSPATVSGFSSKAGDVSVVQESNNFRIRHKLWPSHVTLPFVWLRDHCRCPTCFSWDTMQRKVVVQSSWLSDLSPTNDSTTVSDDGEELRITWEDGHRSSYNLSWLWNNCYEGKKHAEKRLKRHLWDAATLRLLGGVPNVHFDDLMNSDKTVAEVIRHVLTLGVCTITKAPVTVEGTRNAIERVCPIMPTFWSRDISVLEYKAPLVETTSDRSRTNGDDLAYSAAPLPPHVDGNYLLDGPGIQVFHMTENSVIGGETTLVDGFDAAETLKDSSQNDYAILSTVPITFEYTERLGMKIYRSTSTVLKHDPLSNELCQIRHCPNDVAPIATILPSEILGFYSAYVRLLENLNRPEAAFKTLLQPGNILLVDNWRVMHGRTGFAPVNNKSKRILIGAYLERANFLSRARSLEVLDD